MFSIFQKFFDQLLHHFEILATKWGKNDLVKIYFQPKDITSLWNFPAAERKTESVNQSINFFFCENQSFSRKKEIEYTISVLSPIFLDEDFDLVGNGLCRGKEWQIEGLWPKDEGVETFDRCNLECKKDQACTAFDVSPSEQKGLYRCHHFGHDKVTATNR